MNIRIPFAGMHPLLRLVAIILTLWCAILFTVIMAVVIVIHAFGALVIDFVDTFAVQPTRYVRSLISRKRSRHDQTHHRPR